MVYSSYTLFLSDLFLYLIILHIIEMFYQTFVTFYSLVVLTIFSTATAKQLTVASRIFYVKVGKFIKIGIFINIYFSLIPCTCTIRRTITLPVFIFTRFTNLCLFQPPFFFVYLRVSRFFIHYFANEISVLLGILYSDRSVIFIILTYPLRISQTLSC